MDRLNRAVLQTLTEETGQPAVTIYVPVHTSVSPPHISENQLRLKNLLHAAAKQVREKDKPAGFDSELEDKAAELHDDLSFWEEQSPGLLICAVPGSIRLFSLPVDTEEYVAVDSCFHLAAMIGLLHDEHEFYLLSLAQQNPKLYKGSLLYGLQPSQLRLPRNPKSALNLDETNQKSENLGSTVGPSSRPGWFNGRGGARNPQEEDRLRFFRLIDNTICEKTDRKLPLMLAGTEEDVAEFRHLSRNSHLMDGAIAGNRTNDDPRQLFEQAATIVRRELVVPEHQSILEDYQMISGARPERVVRDHQSIAAAAKEGRVDKLLARLSQRTSDTVRESLQDVPRLTFPQNREDNRHLNSVALNVWRNSGRVYNLMPDEMPEPQGLMFARLRY